MSHLLLHLNYRLYLPIPSNGREQMANKIIRFEFEPDYDFELFALVSNIKEHTLAWHLNAILEMDLGKGEDIELGYIKEANKYISNFVFHSEYSTVRLLKNRLYTELGESAGYLLPELKSFDYLLKIEGDSVWEIADGLPEKLKSLPCVQYFEKLKIETLKSKDNLLF